MASKSAAGRQASTGYGLRADCAVLLIEHDVHAVLCLADEVPVLVAGRVIASGAPDEVRRSPEVKAAYLGDLEEAL